MGIVGLEFEKGFIHNNRHPDGTRYAICQRIQSQLDAVCKQCGVKRLYTSFEELICAPEINAVYINSSIQLRVSQNIAALKAGEHVACTVPAATAH